MQYQIYIKYQILSLKTKHFNVTTVTKIQNQPFQQSQNHKPHPVLETKHEIHIIGVFFPSLSSDSYTVSLSLKLLI